MGIIITILVGLVAGILGKLIMPGKDPGGTLVTILIGIAGSFVGSFVGRILPFIPEGNGGFNLGTIVSATIGAIILLFLYRVITKKKAK